MNEIYCYLCKYGDTRTINSTGHVACWRRKHKLMDNANKINCQLFKDVRAENAKRKN